MTLLAHWRLRRRLRAIRNRGRAMDPYRTPFWLYGFAVAWATSWGVLFLVYLSLVR